MNNYFNVYNEQYYVSRIDFVTFYILPNLYILIDCLLLFIALIWICRSLKHDKHVMGNEKYMVLHSSLLVLTLGSQVYLAYSYHQVWNSFRNKNELMRSADLYCRAWKIFSIFNAIETMIMVYIMDQVNTPQKIVWAS